MRRRLELTGISAQGRVETPQTSHHSAAHTHPFLLLLLASSRVLSSCVLNPHPSLLWDLIPLFLSSRLRIGTYITYHHRYTTLPLHTHTYLLRTYVHTNPYIHTSIHPIHRQGRVDKVGQVELP
ncbi:hypothetical protein K449DRAFT_171092 [Hypoxylon sp. EC38]|nr:hypothetical protein K449DRAFT_171092 [Hypoxylon sp. EC38]